MALDYLDAEFFDVTWNLSAIRHDYQWVRSFLYKVSVLCASVGNVDLNYGLKKSEVDINVSTKEWSLMLQQMRESKVTSNIACVRGQ